MSHTCINIPFRLAITTAARTDCQERQGDLLFGEIAFHVMIIKAHSLSLWWPTVMRNHAIIVLRIKVYLLQGFQQFPQGNDGNHHNPSRDNASNLKDTYLL